MGTINIEGKDFEKNCVRDMLVEHSIFASSISKRQKRVIQTTIINHMIRPLTPNSEQ